MQHIHSTEVNMQSSMEVVLVAVDDVMLQIVWTHYFLDHQGWNLSDCVVYQDKKSAILLKQNGWAVDGTLIISPVFCHQPDLGT